VSAHDGVGFLAAGLVFAAFGMKEMAALRIVAMCSNLAFIVYGVGLDLMPVWLLHAVLLPLNGWRLLQALRSPGQDGQPRPLRRHRFGMAFSHKLGLHRAILVRAR
jgi:hypothetical protein